MLEGTVNDKLAALEIILTCPLWPHRHELTESGMALHDVMVEGGKAYALLVAKADFTGALTILGQWGGIANALMDDPAAIDTDGRNKMIAVWKHYADAVGIDFTKTKE